MNKYKIIKYNIICIDIYIYRIYNIHQLQRTPQPRPEPRPPPSAGPRGRQHGSPVPRLGSLREVAFFRVKMAIENGR